MQQDDRYYLKVLSFCHWAFAAMIVFGGMMVCTAIPQTDARACGAAFIAVGLLSATAGLFLFTQRNYWFILAISVFALLVFPLGTILGICTIVVLRKDGVSVLFKV